MGAGYRLPVPEWTGELRRCVLCKRLDHPVYAGGSDEKSGEPIFLHSVTLDVVLTKSSDLTAKDKREGFVGMELEGGFAKVRAICRDCLEADEQTKAVWKDFEKTRQDQQQEMKEPSWYAQLCS